MVRTRFPLQLAYARRGRIVKREVRQSWVTKRISLGFDSGVDDGRFATENAVQVAKWC